MSAAATEIELRPHALTAEHWLGHAGRTYLEQPMNKLVTKCRLVNLPILAAVRRKLNTGLYDGVFSVYRHCRASTGFEGLSWNRCRQKPFYREHDRLCTSPISPNPSRANTGCTHGAWWCVACHAIIHPGNSSFSLCAHLPERLPCHISHCDVSEPVRRASAHTHWLTRPSSAGGGLERASLPPRSPSISVRRSHSSCSLCPSVRHQELSQGSLTLMFATTAFRKAWIPSEFKAQVTVHPLLYFLDFKCVKSRMPANIRSMVLECKAALFDPKPTTTWLLSQEASNPPASL